MNNLPSICFSVPSKTFLLGEYSALAKKNALLLATEPRFSLYCESCDESSQSQLQFMHVSEQGPVACLIEHIQAELDHYRFVFVDPYSQHPGGFGASSAQYLLLYQCYCHYKQIPFNLKKCLDQFYQDLNSPADLLPSGADLAAQYSGGLTLFSDPIDQSTILVWPWPELTGVILKTNFKLATYTYLSQLGLSDLPIDVLDPITQQGIHAIQTNNASQLLDAITQFQRCLTENQLTCENTLQLLNQLYDCPFVLATKGCGAQGADVIIAFVSTSQLALFHHWIKTQTTLLPIATTQMISNGLTEEIQR